MRIRRVLLVLNTVVLASTTVFAGGPMIVGGPAVGTRAAFGIDGKPFTWDPAKMPVQYRVDPGPMAITGTTTVIDHATGVQRVRAGFDIWQNVSTANVSFTNAGDLLPVGSYTGGDVTTVGQYNDLIGDCKTGKQSPVVFDADGSIIKDLGLPPQVIGFSTPCGLDTVNGRIIGAAIVLNGKDQDGISSGAGTSNPNYELTATQFDEAMTHEMGHLLGLDHSQINVDLYTARNPNCDHDGQAGLPLMFPVEFCAARKDVGLPILSPDDLAWISYLYPSATFTSAYGIISGHVYFSDGVSQAQGINVIARRVDDPNTPEDESRRIAVSVVSGFLFTGNPGQAVTANTSDASEHNSSGSPDGSRQAGLLGYYEIPVPIGTFTVEVEAINPDFTSLGPLSQQVAIPGGPEFWNQYESAFDIPAARDMVNVGSGSTISGIDVILNDRYATYDDYEDIGWAAPMPLAQFFGPGARS